MVKNKQLHQSTLLSNITGLAHGFTDRRWGDMKFSQENRAKLMDTCFPRATSLIVGEQTHNANVAIIESDSASTFERSGVDALVYKKNSFFPIALGVTTADCVPILLTDPYTYYCDCSCRLKGAVAGVIANTVRSMKRLGAQTNRILAFIGPHIGMCCYSVMKERIDRFIRMCGDDQIMYAKFEDGWHLDLGRVSVQQLLAEGLQLDNIDAPIFVLLCQVDRFFLIEKIAKLHLVK
jgi:hypothetical protein